MRIGIITYYRVANFGANLQAVSTYRYLEKVGHTPIFIQYTSHQLYLTTDCCYDTNLQVKAHLDFVDSIILRHTRPCFTADDVNRVIAEQGIEALIIGSDAVLQHHPLRSRIHIKGHYLKRIAITKVNDERRFPNIFWGCGLTRQTAKALMSVSSQSSEFRYFSSKLKERMNDALQEFSYISVRDTWTQKMLYDITGQQFPMTPDPVFAFNQNAGDLIPTRNEILKRFHLPDDYVLVSFVNVRVPEEVITRLDDLLAGKAVCIALPSPLGVCFSHHLSHEVPMPLDPLDWYALIKYSRGYVGNNMHPIVVALHNGIPCFSIDNYSNYDFRGRPRHDGASKIEDLLRFFHLQNNHIVPYKGNTRHLAETIHDSLLSFPSEQVIQTAKERYTHYEIMMQAIIKSIQS